MEVEEAEKKLCLRQIVPPSSVPYFAHAHSCQPWCHAPIQVINKFYCPNQSNHKKVGIIAGFLVYFGSPDRSWSTPPTTGRRSRLIQQVRDPIMNGLSNCSTRFCFTDDFQSCKLKNNRLDPCREKDQLRSHPRHG